MPGILLCYSLAVSSTDPNVTLPRWSSTDRHQMAGNTNTQNSVSQMHR